jgi:hypothetical protein
VCVLQQCCPRLSIEDSPSNNIDLTLSYGCDCGVSQTCYLSTLQSVISVINDISLLPYLRNFPQNKISKPSIITSVTTMSSTLQRYANGTPLSTMIPEPENSRRYISVVSFNLLAPAYVRPIDSRTGQVQPFAAFEWVKDDAILEWETRKLRLLQSLRSCQANVICLQELQLERSLDTKKLDLPAWIRSMMDDDDYEAILPPQEELEVIAGRNIRVLGLDAAVTCAVLVQIRQWEILKPPSTNNKRNEDTNTCVSVCLRPTSNNKCTLSDSISPVVVTSVHLDATDEKKRVGQLSRCLRRARALIDVSLPQDNNHSGAYSIHSLSTIIAGDMNTEFLMGSCVAGFFNGHEEPTVSDLERECAAALRLPSGTHPSANQLKEWNELHSEASQMVRDYCVSIARVDTGPTRSAYNHDNDQQQMAQWKLDHMVHTLDRFRPIAQWSTMEEDPESCAVGLPNANCPSDHLPIAAVFEVFSAVKLEEENKRALLDNLHCLLETQKHELQELEANLDTELKSIEAQVASCVTAQNTIREDSNTKKAKKRKKGPPPMEIVECMRKRRSQVKSLKAEQRLQRQGMVEPLSNLERLAIQEEFGHSASLWVERGS